MHEPKSSPPQQQLRNVLPGTEASPQGSSQSPLAQLLGSAQLCTPLLPGIEGGGQPLVPDPVGNGSAGLAAVVELQPGLPGGGHRLVLQPGHNAQLDAACCACLHLARLQHSNVGDLLCSSDWGSNARLSPTPLLASGVLQQHLGPQCYIGNSVSPVLVIYGKLVLVTCSLRVLYSSPCANCKWCDGRALTCTMSVHAFHAALTRRLMKLARICCPVLLRCAACCRAEKPFCNADMRQCSAACITVACHLVILTSCPYVTPRQNLVPHSSVKASQYLQTS